MISSHANDDDQVIRRRRQCPRCNRRFITTEMASLQVIKRPGAYEPFSREKTISEMGKAYQGRLVNEDDLAESAQLAEKQIRANGALQIKVHETGLTILEPLREFDTIAYLRFVSIYLNYDPLDNFENAIRELCENLSESAG